MRSRALQREPASLLENSSFTIMPFNAKGIVYITFEWIFILVQITVITLRLYSRSFLTRSIGSDDFFIVIAFVRWPGSRVQ